MENSSEVTVNLTGNPGGQVQKNRYPLHGRGGGKIFSWKSQIFAQYLDRGEFEKHIDRNTNSVKQSYNVIIIIYLFG